MGVQSKPASSPPPKPPPPPPQPAASQRPQGPAAAPAARPEGPGPASRPQAAPQPQRDTFGDKPGGDQYAAGLRGESRAPAAAATQNPQRSEPPRDGQLYGPQGAIAPQPGQRLEDLPATEPRGANRTGQTVLYVNGINTQAAGAANQAQQLADASGHRVVGIYNATEGQGR